MAQTQITGSQVKDSSLAGSDVQDGSLTDADLAAANKDGAAGTPSLRTLGTGAQQAAAGDHSHGSASTDGWTAAAATWTYASATTFTVSGDVTAIFAKGAKLRLKQGGAYKYFYVVGSAYSAPNTTVTVTGGSDYSLANAAITDNYYSYAAIAQGFPQWFNWTPTWGGFSINPGGTNRFMIQGNTCFVEREVGVAGTSNATTCSLTLPVAAAVVNGRFLVMCYDNGAWLNTVGGNYAAGSTTLNLFPTISGGVWTATGSKDTLMRGFYEI